MMAPPLPFPIMALLLFCCLFLSPAVAPGDELDQAVSAFRHAAVRSDSGKRQAALDALVDLGDPGALPALFEAYVHCTEVLDGAQSELSSLRAAIAQRERTIAGLRLRAKKDGSLETSLQTQTTRLGLLHDEVERQEELLAVQQPWQAALSAGTTRLLEGLGAGARRKAEERIWEAIDPDGDPATLLAAVQLVGTVGRAGTAVRLQKFLGAIDARSQAIERKLPKKEAEVRKLEARMQKEAAQMGGRLSQATAQQYDKLRREASGDRRTLALLAHVLDACVHSAGLALSREDEATRLKSLRSLTRAMRKAKGAERLRSLSILASVPCAPAQAALREALTDEKDPAAIARTLEDLARLGDREIVDDLLDTYLDHEAWIVRSSAARSLALLREKRGIGPMIERLESSEGRWTTDLREALRSLTGQDFHTNAELWARWWKANAQTFEVPTATEPREQQSSGHDDDLVTFFGIQTTSRRVLFILDLSGSMNWSLVPRDNPDDDPNLPPDLPRGREMSRLTAAKRDLMRALSGLGPGAHFNLVLYASDVWTWKDKLAVMDDKTRVSVQDYVESLEAEGGTNIYGALKLALELAGADGGESWSEPAIDTIFLLTDGHPSVGVVTDPEGILDFVREKNQRAGIVIHTIGLSGSQDAYLLSKLAEENGGTYASR